MNIPVLDDKQKAREKLLNDLMRTLWYQNQEPGEIRSDTRIVLTGYDDSVDKPIWMHFTDWYNQLDLDALLKNDMLERHPSLTYSPDGTYHDEFPPTAYQLTDKGKSILKARALWVFDGKVASDTKSDI